MRSDISNYRPSKRPKVSQVSKWDLIYDDDITNHWSRSTQGTIQILMGYPFPDFYKVVTTNVEGAKKSKLFYGESAYYQVQQYVSDFGVRSVYSGF